jgi:hypothetical protein
MKPIAYALHGTAYPLSRQAFVEYEIYHYCDFKRGIVEFRSVHGNFVFETLPVVGVDFNDHKSQIFHWMLEGKYGNGELIYQ